MPDPMSADRPPFARLVDIMRALRTPETGCPWDLEQTFETIAPYTLEEAYEVADAIRRGDMTDLRDELGDLLLQVVFHAQMASEAGAFSVTDVIEAINSKMIRRHPHVFGSDSGISDAAAQTRAWEQMKAEERAQKADSGSPPSALEGVAQALPALVRAGKLQKRAARTGFDWTNPDDIFAKLDEESQEVREALSQGDPAHIEEEIGDLLFVVANLARRVGVDPEQALSRANLKFETRFRGMEAMAEQRGFTFGELTLEQQESLWQEVKARARSGQD